MRAFTEHMGASFKDAGLDSDPTTAEYGREEEKVTLYDNGVPEMIGKKTVEKLFEGQVSQKKKNLCNGVGFFFSLTASSPQRPGNFVLTEHT